MITALLRVQNFKPVRFALDTCESIGRPFLIVDGMGIRGEIGPF